MHTVRSDHMALPQVGTVYTWHSIPIPKIGAPLDSDYPLEAVCLDCLCSICLEKPDGNWEHFSRD